ncbi:hypothetical protein C3L33_15139, partial [Rhododendron williamsianum]
MQDQGITPNIVIYNILINGMCKAGKIDDSWKIFSSISARGLQPTIKTYNTMISGLCKETMLDEVEELLWQMEGGRCPPDDVTYNIVVRAFRKRGDNDKIEVNAPSLLYIKAMKVLSSQLAEARIDFELCPKQCGDVYEKSLLELLEGILMSKLHIYLVIACRRKLTVFPYLTSLKLSVERDVDWRALLDILESSPHLRTLIFVEGLFHFKDGLKPWDPPEHIPPCLLVILNIIDIRRFQGDKCELNMVKY